MNCLTCNKSFKRNRKSAKYCGRECYLRSRQKDPYKVIKTNYIVRDSGCWEWQGSTNVENYGRIQFLNKTYMAHKVSWEVHKGKIPEGMIICHECDNPICINPDHLFLGTYKDNSKDMVSKGRNQDIKGNKNPMSKLNKQDIIKIINDDRIYKEKAKDYNITAPHVCAIKSKRRWGHIHDIG